MGMSLLNVYAHFVAKKMKGINEITALIPIIHLS
jgi:hypothetical protein